MFKRRTLFVVGAGASKEFGLPLGPELAATVATKLDIKYEGYNSVSSGDADIASQLRNKPAGLGRLLSACHAIRDGVRLSSSIDDFLDLHATNDDVQTVGKIAIAKSVLEEERGSKLYFDKSNIFNKMSVGNFENTWLIKFVRMLGRGVPKERIANIFADVSFIVFNYDRCIEQCLYHALQQLYSIPPEAASGLLQKLTIIHPYGAVGILQTHGTPGGVAYGGSAHGLSEDYSALSKRIKTYTEQLDDPTMLTRLHSEFTQAERIVFLGFAFHDQNVALLRPSGPLRRKEIYATAFGMSPNDVDVVNAQLLSFFEGRELEIMHNGHVTIRADLTCSTLFDQYARSFPN